MFGVQKKHKEENGNKAVRGVTPTDANKSVSSMVEIDAFLLAYAREKYGPDKKKREDDTPETL